MISVTPDVQNANCRLFCEAQILGITSPNKIKTKLTMIIFIRNSTNHKFCLNGVTWSIRKLDNIITQILTRIFAIIKEASRVFGCSIRLTILFHDASCFVFRILMSLSVREKKAILDPETINERTRKNKIRITNTVVACALMINNKDCKWPATSILLKG